jgi:hypothetical protein
MASSFPTKANWAAGDVLTAAQMDDLAGTVNLLSNASATTGSQLISNAAGTSFAYSPTPSASNPVLNSAFQVWQRGTSIAYAGGNQYTADRWCFGSGSTGRTVSRQATADTTNLPNIQYCARVQRDSGNTNTAALKLNQSFENLNSIPFAGKTVLLSFYARAGANFSGASNLMTGILYSGTGTDQNVDVAYTGQATVATASATLTTSWQRFTATGTISTSATEIALMLSYTPVGTAGAADYFEVTGLQIDVGSVALPFRTYAATYQAELAACQRYYWQSASGSSNYFWGGQSLNGSYATVTCKLPVTMRVSPTVTLTSQDNSGFAATAGSVIRINPDSFSEQRTSNATVGSAYFGSSVVATAEL